MKNSFWKWSLGLSLTGLLPLVGGCLQNTSTASTPASTNSQIIAAATASTNAAAGETNAVTDEDLAADTDVVTAPARPISVEKPLPSNVKPTPPAAEIIKLANAGVDESVMLAYVTNSANTFNLGADEVVYFTDLGVPPAVITAMIQHDQTLKAGSANLPPSSAVASATGNILVPSPGAPNPYPAPASASQSNPEPIAADPNSVNTAPPPPGEQVQAAPGAPESAPTSQVFYDSLAPYGTWLEVEGYGRVWQPSVVVINRTWRPYYDNGRWIYTNHGWYWYSDYSWGWAPFHYGRWFRHAHYGWCWTPDYVWGPSWVSWRYSSDYCGWAPLPPAAYYRPGFGFSYYGSSVGFNFGFGLGYDSYSFVHFRHFRSHRFHHHHRLPREHVTQIYNKTVVVNKIVGDNNTIINSGVPVENVARATKREVPRVQVREVAAAPARGTRAEQVEASGTLAVYRPQIAPSESSLPKTAPRRPDTLSSSPRSSLATRSAAVAPSAPVAASSGSARISGRAVGDPAPAVSRQTVAPSSRTAPSRAGSSASSMGSSVISRPFERPGSVTSGSRSVERGSATAAAPSPTVERGSAPERQVPARPTVSSTAAPRAEAAPPAAAASPSASDTVSSRSERSSGAYVQRPYGSLGERQAPSRSPSASPSLTPNAPSRQVAPSTTALSRPSYSAPQRTAPTVSTPSAPPTTRQYATPAPSVRSQAPASSSPYSAPSVSAPSYSAPVRPAPSYSAPARPAPSYSAPARPAPSYSAPARPAPSYSAPAAPSASYSAPARSYAAPSQSYSAPTPSYSAPSRPAPSYSAPSRPAPSYSAPSRPAPSAPSRSYSSGGGRESASPRLQVR